MRLLCIDLGDRRTGLAMGDDQSGIVSPVGLVEVPRGPRLIEAVLERIEEHAPDAVIVGLPLNMDGTESERSKIARAFGEALSKACGCPLSYQDERLTSYAANQAMARTGRTHRQKKRLRDSLAAVEILQDHLQAATRRRSDEGQE